MASDAGATLFDYLKMKFRVDTGCRLICPIPSSVWKDYKRQWVVLSLHISPPECYLTYCTQEEEWLMNQPTLPKIILDNFKVTRCVGTSQGGSSLRVGSGGSNRNILEVNFEHFTMFLEYGSMTKLQAWYDHLEKIKNRTFVELVRCPEHPEREREYVLQIMKEKILFYSPRLLPSSRLMTEFEWRLDNIRRAKFHKNVGKVEVEVGRAAETGEGHFYFIGPQVKNFFTSLKERIEELSTIASLKDRGKDLHLRPHPPSSDETIASLLSEVEPTRAESPPSSGSGSGDLSLPRFFINPPPPPPRTTLSPPPVTIPLQLSPSPSHTPPSPPAIGISPPLPQKASTTTSNKIYETMRPLMAAEGGEREEKREMYFNKFKTAPSSREDFYQPLQLSTRHARMDYDVISKRIPSSSTASDFDTCSTHSSSTSEGGGVNDSSQ